MNTIDKSRFLETILEIIVHLPKEPKHVSYKLPSELWAVQVTYLMDGHDVEMLHPEGLSDLMRDYPKSQIGVHFQFKNQQIMLTFIPGDGILWDSSQVGEQIGFRYPVDDDAPPSDIAKNLLKKIGI